jgi:hypothetical protein
MAMPQTISLTVSPLYVKLSDKEYSLGERETLRLRDFQAMLLEVLKNVENRDISLLVAPTGSGKTASLLLPLLANIELGSWFYPGVTGVYPSRELVEDQMGTFENLLLKLGLRPINVSSVFKELNLKGEEVDKLRRYVKCFNATLMGEEVPLVLITVTSSSLKGLRDVIGKYLGSEVTSSNLKLLEWIWNSIRGKAYRVVFTVPEYPYLLASTTFRDFHSAGLWLYRAVEDMNKLLPLERDLNSLRAWLEELESKVGRERVFSEYYVSRKLVNELSEVFLLFRTPVLFFDEFHLYSGPSLASFMALLYIYTLSGSSVGKALSGIRKIIISSATPEKHIDVGQGSRDIIDLVRSLAEVSCYRIVEINAETACEPSTGFVQIRRRTLVHFIPGLCEGVGCLNERASFGMLQKDLPRVIQRVNWVERLKVKRKGMIIVDRVATAVEVCEYLQKLGEKPKLVVSLGELLPEFRSETPLKEAKLVVGTIAIAYGIDVEDVDLGLVVAKDYVAAIQKIGRIGRGGGEGYAEVYLPIPYSALERLKNSERLRGLIEGSGRSEMPYVGKDGFLELLREVYPAPAADPLLRTPPLVLKMVLPIWVYALASIIRERSEKRADIAVATHPREIREFGMFLEYVDRLGLLLGVRRLGEKLARYVIGRVYLTPLGLYHLFSFRSSIGVPIKRELKEGCVVDEVSLVVAGRNIPLKYENGELLYDDTRALYGYFSLWIGVEEGRAEEVRDLLKLLARRILTFRFIGKLLRRYRPVLVQGNRRVCLLQDIAEETVLGEVPVLVLVVGPGSTAELIENLSALGEAIPIYTMGKEKRDGEERINARNLLGALQLL